MRCLHVARGLRPAVQPREDEVVALPVAAHHVAAGGEVQGADHQVERCGGDAGVLGAAVRHPVEMGEVDLGVVPHQHLIALAALVRARDIGLEIGFHQPVAVEVVERELVEIERNAEGAEEREGHQARGEGQDIGRHRTAGIQRDEGGAYQHHPPEDDHHHAHRQQGIADTCGELGEARQERAPGGRGPAARPREEAGGGHADEPAAQDAQRRAGGVHRIGQPGQAEHHHRDRRHVVVDPLGGGESGAVVALEAVGHGHEGMEEEGHRLSTHVDAERQNEIAESRARDHDVVDGDRRGGDEGHDGDGPEGEVLAALLHGLALHVEEPVGKDIGHAAGDEEAHHGGGGADADRPQERIAAHLAGQRPVQEGPQVVGRGQEADLEELGPRHEGHDAPVGPRHADEEEREEEQVVEEAAEEVADRTQDLSREQTVPHDDEVAVGAEVADLVLAVELAHRGLLGHIGVEGQGGRLGAEVGGLPGVEGVSLLPGAGLSGGPALAVREQRAEAGADIPAARDRC